MAVAFTREEDYEAQAANLPDRPVSPHPNLVTASGLARIEAELAAARAPLTPPPSRRVASAPTAPPWPAPPATCVTGQPAAPRRS